ncbi:LysR family transcriptional regulator [Photobacterium iliopiscarium]|jgi:DNA-binding transcriptional LysR family regulator|uniref:LysR family transcriptional regulator n=1 Tax=Photobacterium iliopiscarium TaxID=56192 RepID=A0ABX5GMW9_9GAMM|nr:LysR family transcriptional regulator [Photobacterium iliopiscarium]KJG19536.1 LysR family transcriptional regulator [Photobacterium iliopiscarium]PST88964.1 LysR family transcriptional regulator [Photobacterium iliopiscarium]PSU00197.1 LysR family transcriptional regulator [Photobacterium iliopiscarium]PSV84730.1 LysR family transcriptional regulator [Photobacterium iliopiscarium]PSW92364.1 LysR family transcriptional regulator [Photobacterium iliopiscarium]
MKASMDDLYLFMLTVRHGGISAAATAHGLQRSKISRRLQELEKALHCQLLIRTTRHIELTENGRLLYQHINQPLTEVNHAINLLESQQNSLQGVLRLAATASFISSPMFAEVLDTYANQFPLVRIELLYLQKSVDLERENIDLQLLPNMAEIINVDYVQQAFLTSSNGLFASSEYLKQHSEPKTIAELQQHWLLASRYNSTLLQEGTRLRLMSEDINMIQQMAVFGQGIALLPNILMQESLLQGKLVQVLTDVNFSDIMMTVVYPSRRFLPEKTRAMVTLLREKFADQS